jgi:hypothetical protein
MLSALERLQLHDATPLGSDDGLNRTAPTDTIGPGSLAAWRPLVETPPRRKSSALSLSHLTPVTPPVRGANGETRLASDAVRDIERELEAVEARLSVFRERRETANDDSVDDEEDRLPSQDPTEKELIPVEKQIAKAVDLSSPTRTEKPPHLRMTQQAGEVADEVDHALATCDRLVQQAKLHGKGHPLLLVAYINPISHTCLLYTRQRRRRHSHGRFTHAGAVSVLPTTETRSLI